MQVSEELRKRRGRPRKYARDEAAQASAFPQEEVPQSAEKIENDAAEKERVKKAIAAIPDIFTPENVAWAFDVYVGLLSFAYSYILKTDFDAIQKELEFSEEQKASLAKPLAKICSKYAPAEWAGMTAEIQLVSMMGIWTVASFQRAKNVRRELEEKKKDAERTQPVQPIRREQSVREAHV